MRTQGKWETSGDCFGAPQVRANGEYICKLDGIEQLMSHRQANAEFICKAVNEHDTIKAELNTVHKSLLKVCKENDELVDRLTNHGERSGHHNDCRLIHYADGNHDCDCGLDDLLDKIKEL